MKRIRYFDWLRVICMLGVIVIHVCNESRVGLELDDSRFVTFFIFRCLVRWSVPVFVMISGALFLDPERELSAQQLYTKNLARLIVSFFLCSSSYSVYRALFRTGVSGIRNVLVALVKGPYHLWFLPMLLGLYLVTPLLRRIVEERKALNLFLILSLLFAIIFPTFESVCKALLSVEPNKYVEFFYTIEQTVIGGMHVRLVIGYTFYYVLGYLLHKCSPTGRVTALVIVLGVISIPVTIGFSLFVSNATGELFDALLGYLTLPTALQSASVFLAFQRAIPDDELPVEKDEDKFDVIRWISERSFGVYLVHVMVIWAANDSFGLIAQAFNPVLSVPILTIAVAVISLCIAEILSRIPVLKRFVH